MGPYIVTANKGELRGFYKGIRDAIPKAEKKRLDEEYTNRIFELEGFKKSDIFLAYFSVGSEFDTRRLIARAKSLGKKVALPRIFGGDMFFFEDSGNCGINGDGENYIKNRFGIPEPISETEINCSSGGIFAVVPCLAADKNNFRLGYGGGYYDKFLARRPEIFTVAVCYGVCFSETLPSETFDVPMKIIIT